MSFSGQQSKTQLTGSRTEVRKSENASEGDGRGGKERICSEEKDSGR